MAWYRCGGGGIPSSLKGDMNDVFNKKFGTTLQDYPPEDWPETVNLMGPLPEKTVSGSVVTFSDGADAVLLKSCNVTIAPNLDGVSSVDVVHGGLNLFNRTHTDTSNGYADNRYLGASGSGQSSQNFIVSEYTEVDAGETITISNASGNSPAIVFYNASKQVISGVAYANQSTITIIVPENTVYFRASVPKVNLETYQIEYGSTATTPTTHTANLGRTIYGGTPDVVNGTGTESAEKSVLDPTETWLYSSSWSKTNTNVFYTQSTHDEISFATWSDNSILLCDTFSVGTRNEINNADTNMIGVSGNVGHPCITVRIDKTTCPDLASFIQYITNNQISFVYKKATPETFTFTPVPINSLLGDNTMWGDGDLSVTYRRDIDLALAQ